MNNPFNIFIFLFDFSNITTYFNIFYKLGKTYMVKLLS